MDERRRNLVLVRLLIGIAILNFVLSPAIAEELTDLAFILKFNPITSPVKRSNRVFNLREISEFKLISTGLIKIYQKFISSQDSEVCNFIPSCSRFGMFAIQKFGVVRGIALITDRLCRCNGMATFYYPTDPRTGLCLDPINYYSHQALRR